MILVEIRGRCRHVLARIEQRQVPADWSGSIDVPVCGRCDSRRPGEGRFIPWARGKARRGSGPPFTVTFHRVSWTELRPYVEEAWRDGKTVAKTI